VLRALFVHGEWTTDLGTVTVQLLVGARKQQSVVVDCVGVALHQILMTSSPNRESF
jgi:hypothetical protein